MLAEFHPSESVSDFLRVIAGCSHGYCAFEMQLLHREQDDVVQ